VFNAEKYLSNCIESILSQTYTNFEILLINDGSKDASGDICDKYVMNDSRVKVIHKHNEGVSAARNLGLELASGEYVCFVDSDDWIERNFLKTVSENINSVDLVILTDVAYDYPNNTIIRNSKYSKNIYYNADIIYLLIENNFFTISDGGAFSKLFRADLLKYHSIKFQLNNAAYEDTLFTFEYLSKCDSVSIAYGSCYHYMQRDSEVSLSRKAHPFQNYIDSGNKGLKLLFELSTKFNTDVNSIFHTMGVTKFLGMLNYSIFSLYPSYNKLNKQERIDLLEYLSQQNVTLKHRYRPNNYKDKLVHYIVRLHNKKFADIVFILLFKISKIIK
jgi:glycosyltransferase involved in cell wall biosynthesis